MVILYHHYKDSNLELDDKKHNWWTCPPELICTQDEDKKLVHLWHKYTGENNYIVDPLSHNQCLYVMLKQLPWYIHWFTKWSPKRITKQHIYDVKPER